MNKFNRGTKFIVILRNPTDGLFSEYLNHGDKTKSTDILSEKSAQLFHYHTLQVIGMYEDCFKKQNIRACIYDTLLAEEARKAQVFPREQFFFVKMEEYSKNTSHVLQEIFSFLGVGPLESSVVDAVAKAPAINSSNQTKSEMEPMFPETRAKLDEFFSPFRKTLANMLDHPKYSWAEEEMRGAK
ncbi:carbohydrate sulfotransferase 15-like [Lineus longissimus]|uniref:carbohydrate sulfotransferase 15-like n=1 Tax=Lineus longissimus TaxID=88925 RepID=UPI00315DB8C1